MSVPPHVNRLASSWVANADAWTTAVRTGAIASRRAGTDNAILHAILHAIEQAPAGPLLDVGCGEGWLSRAICSEGRNVLGIDASAPLVEAARSAHEHHGVRYETVSYAELATRGSELGAPFSVAVCNFALLDDNINAALSAIHAVLAHNGSLLIQTVHPFTACGDQPYENGWREETFDAFGGRFPSAMPWYFRTLESWVTELRAAGFVLESVNEPRAANAALPLSLLISARRVS